VIYLSKKAGKIGVLAVFSVFLVTLCILISCERRELIPPCASNDETGEVFTEVSDDKATAEFLMQFGLIADGKPVVKDRVTIPEVFPDYYEEYNEIQKKTGFDLSMFKGAEVNRIVFRRRNSPDLITLLIYKGHVIGGHLCSGEYGEKNRALID
jgi:hypothetical protein